MATPVVPPLITSFSVSNLLQFRIVIIPESHPTRSKRRRHLGCGFNSQIRSVSGVVPVPCYTADWLWRWIAGLDEVCVRCHDELTDVFVGRVIPRKPQWDSKGKKHVFAMNNSHPLRINTGVLWTVSKLVHVHRSIFAVNISNLVTWCSENLITDEVDKSTSQCVFITVIRPWRVHELQRVRDEVGGFISKKGKRNNRCWMFIIKEKDRSKKLIIPMTYR